MATSKMVNMLLNIIAAMWKPANAPFIPRRKSIKQLAVEITQNRP